MLDRVINFLREFDQNEHCSRVAIIKLTYIYYKSDNIYETIIAKFKNQSSEK